LESVVRNKFDTKRMYSVLQFLHAAGDMQKVTNVKQKKKHER